MKVAFITGGTKGIGAALVEKFLAEGYHVALTGRDIAAPGVLNSLLQQYRDKILILKADSAVEEEVTAAVAQVIHAWQRLDVVVANAGYCAYGKIGELAPKVYTHQMQVNFHGVVATIHAALPSLRQSRGAIIIIGSASGLIGLGGRSAYAASKFALRGFAQSIAEDLAADGVSVQYVAPGYVKTISRQRNEWGDIEAGRSESIVEKRLLSPQKVARDIFAALEKRQQKELLVGAQAKIVDALTRFLPRQAHRILKKFGAQ